MGGTGAAGVPILLNGLRSLGELAKPPHNAKLIKDAPIAVLSVQPYFKIEHKDDAKVNSDDFILKTKAALRYYHTTFDKKINAMYYIGDDRSEVLKNDSGAGGQENEAHFVELASALAILDFLKIKDDKMVCENGLTAKSIYKEFGIQYDTAHPNLKDIGKDATYYLKKPFIRLAYAFYYMAILLNKDVNAKKANYWVKLTIKDGTFLHKDFYKMLKTVQDKFFEWLGEMEKTKSFLPFNFRFDENNNPLSFENEDILSMVRQIEPKLKRHPITQRLLQRPKHAKLQAYMNYNTKNIKNIENSNKKLVDLLYIMGNGVTKNYYD